MNKVFFKNSKKMNELKDGSIDLIITSPPYFNIKNYSKDGYQKKIISKSLSGDLGNENDYDNYLKKINLVWKECIRVLRANGKLCINVPLVPISKKNNNINHNRLILDLKNDIQSKILKLNKNINLLDLYIWKRTNSTKRLMFGSYPYPPNFYNNNICEFIIIFVKSGKPKVVESEIKKQSRISKEEWLEYTKQVWDIPIPNKKDIAFGKHCAIMPEEIPRRLIKLFSFVDDVVLDPFTGSGTTLKIAKELKRKYVGYEINKNYKKIIDEKIFRS